MEGGRGRERDREFDDCILVREGCKMKLPLPLQLLLPIICSFIAIICNTTIVAADIFPGSTLYASNASQSWASPSNTFSLSFITQSNAYFAAITFNSVPIWIAGGDGGAADSSAAFQFLSNGNLRLVNGSSGSVVWQSNTTNRGVSSAALEESGYLVLRNGTVPVWSTSDYPTDSLLQGQNFTSGQTLRSGLYSFRLNPSGNLTLGWNDSIVYWNLGLNSSVNVNLTSPSLALQPIGVVSLFDPMLTNPVFTVYSSDYAASNVFRFLKLDSDGNLRIYSSASGSGTETVGWAAVGDQCEVFGYCGDLGVCSYNDTSPVCDCPSQNFEFVDTNDRRKGCKRKVELENCQASNTMLEMDRSRFLTYQPELSSQAFQIGITPCQLNCLISPSCIASTVLADGSGICYLKVPGFVSVYQSPAFPSTSYLKVCGPINPNPTDSSASTQSSKIRTWLMVVIALCIFFGLILLEGGFWWFCCRNRSKLRSLSGQYALLEYASGAPVQFSYRELQVSTKGFKEKLGEGGFGAVYRGVLENRTVIAVKRLEGIEQGEKQFRMEVATISSTHHLNLMRLIGFCSEGRHRLLVYEFMKNGSLDSFLFATEERSNKHLSWRSRFNVALGTARGITYLHEECRDCIVHCDIKPENILLDENYNAKVSDFGLAKLINPNDNRYRTLTSVRGTRGYLAPEWIANLPVTSKSDVYSYGMVLLEIVSGKRNFEVSAETNQKKFSVWAFEEVEKGNIENVVDKSLDRQEVDMEQIRRAIKVSFWCIQEQPLQRPTMGKIVQMLEGITEIGNPPAPKATAEGPVSAAVANASSSISHFSTSAPSAPAPSSSSSFQTQKLSSFASGKNVERASSSLLHSEAR